MNTTRKHYVTFYSPGTLFAETTTKEIDGWDTREAVAMAEAIVERHGARPYAFDFKTMIVAGDVPDGEGGTLSVEPKEVARCGMHFLGGRLETLDDVEARNDPKESILRANMRANPMPIVVVVERGYRSTHIFSERDVVVDAEGKAIEYGDDPKHVAYRERVIAEQRRDAGR